jgi:hypothetical protein
MNSYQFYSDFIAKGRNKTDRPLANNTRVIDRGDRIAIRLHNTDIVSFFPNGDTEFNSGGWRTMTTKDRMHYAGGFTISSRGGNWTILHRGQAAQAEKRLRRKYGLPVSGEDWDDEQGYVNSDGLVHLGYARPRSDGWGFWQEVADLIGRKEAHRIYKAFEAELRERTERVFFDGIRFTQRGRCMNGLDVREEERKVRADERLRKRIREYARLAVTEMDKGMPVTDAGDCFYCQLRAVDEVPQEDRHGFPSGSLRGRPMGDSMGDHEHLREHMREGYVPSALIVNAMDEQPYRDIGKYMHLGIHDNEDGEQMMGGLREGHSGRYARRHSDYVVATAVYQYVGRRLLPGREIRGNFTTGSVPEPKMTTTGGTA